MKRSLSALTLLIAAFMMPANAHADMFSLYVSGKSGIVNGTGTAFTDLNSSFGSGAEAGIELIGIDIFGEALKVGEINSITANLGRRHVYEKWRGGPSSAAQVRWFSGHPTSASFALRHRSECTDRSGFDPDMVETQYNDVKDVEDELNRYTLGWNIVRASFASSVDCSGLLGREWLRCLSLSSRRRDRGSREDNQLNRLDETYQLSQPIPSHKLNRLGAKLLTNQTRRIQLQRERLLKIEI